MTVEYFKRPLNTPAFSILRPSQIYPNWDFWVWKQTIWQPCLAKLSPRFEAKQLFRKKKLSGLNHTR
jgi:hypothetical protein